MGKVERIHTVTDTMTGEILSESKNVINIRPMEPEPGFVKLYVEDLGRLLNLKQGHKDILMYVAASVDYDGIVSMSMGRKARIAATVGCSVKSVNNAIWEYVNAGILKRIGRGEYELDPMLFAKGEWRNIRERRTNFKAVISYTENGREIEVIAD